MKKQYTIARHFWSKKLNRGIRMALRFTVGILLLAVLAFLGIAWYINTHKKQVLAMVTEELNRNLSGSLTIGNIEPTLLAGFPQVSLRLDNVILRDSLYAQHKHTLLDAKTADLALNAAALLRGTVVIKKITVKDAAACIFTDSTGYSNTAVFRRGKDSGKTTKSFPELKKISLENVHITAENHLKGKLFQFLVHSLDGSVTYTAEGWKAGVKLSTLAESLTFNTKKGSYIKNKTVKGKLNISYNKDSHIFTFKPEKLNIGDSAFTIGGTFETGTASTFTLSLKNDGLLWEKATALLSPNVAKKLKVFGLKNPFAVQCTIKGDLKKRGDPLIVLDAKVKDNVLNTPGGPVDHCSFTGFYTNYNEKGRGYNDPNSVIRLTGFKGTYAGIPFTMKKAVLQNLKNPVAYGSFVSDFEMRNLGNIISDKLIRFTKGTAHVVLDFKSDIENFKIARPLVSGSITIKDADVDYMPRQLDFHDINASLSFTSDNLYISNIRLTKGKSELNMQGNIKNFLNLYYSAPEKLVLNWQVNSPRLYLADFMAFAGSRKNADSKGAEQRKGDFTSEVNTLFDKTNVDITLKVDKVYYNRFFASNANANILLTEKGITLNNASLWHSGGLIRLNGNLSQKINGSDYSLNAAIGKVDVSKLFYTFNNFGMQTLTSSHLKGLISTQANVTGSITNAGALVPGSMNGNVSFGLENGALLHFEPVKNVGKFAFPFRNMDTITFTGLNGRFDIHGEKVTIYPMQVNSSVLNMDIEGIYSFGSGTKIYVTVPLRNPKKDKGITDEAVLAKRRDRGIVLHLIAADDEDGKVKVTLGKKKDDD